MKKVRRVIALVGVIVLVALYVTTLVLAVIGSEQTMSMFWAALAATVILPVLMWAYSFIYGLLKKNYSEDARRETEKLREAYRKAQRMGGEDPAGGEECGEEETEDAPPGEDEDAPDEEP